MKVRCCGIRAWPTPETATVPLLLAASVTVSVAVSVAPTDGVKLTVVGYEAAPLIVPLHTPSRSTVAGATMAVSSPAKSAEFVPEAAKVKVGLDVQVAPLSTTVT